MRNSSLHLLAIVSLVTALVAGASVASAASQAPNNRAPKLVAEPLFQLVAARKGTRNFAADGTVTPPADTQADTKTTDAARDADPNSLEGCMAIWDAGTHITRSKWGEICRRQIKEREQHH